MEDVTVTIKVDPESVARLVEQMARATKSIERVEGECFHLDPAWAERVRGKLIMARMMERYRNEKTYT